MNTFGLFGEFFKELRQRKGLTLRNFCAAHGLDPGNISKLERGLTPPPKSRKVLERYTELFGLRKDEDDYYKFFDLASLCYGNFPPYIMDDAALVAKLPLVFRTLRGEEVPADQLKELAELIRRSCIPLAAERAADNANAELTTQILEAEETAQYLLSKEYIELLINAICARITTSREPNLSRHKKAVRLLEEYSFQGKVDLSDSPEFGPDFFEEAEVQHQQGACPKAKEPADVQ